MVFSSPNGRFRLPDPGASPGSRRDSQWAELKNTELGVGIAGLFDRLHRIDELIDYSALLLRIGQPPMHGKLDIRWYRKHDGRPNTPALVRWFSTGTGRSYTRTVTRFHPDMVGAGLADFPNRQLVTDVILNFKSLTAERESIIECLNRISRVSKLSSSKNEGRADDTSADLLVIHEAIVQNLQVAGYDVDRRFHPKIVWRFEDLDTPLPSSA